MKYEKLANYIEKKELNEVISKDKMRQLLYSYYNDELNEKTYRNIIGILKKYHVIGDKSEDSYILYDKQFYNYMVSQEENRIYNEIKEKYENINSLVWNTQIVNEFTQHYAVYNYIIVETEKFAIKLIVNLLKEKFSKNYTVITQDILNNNKEIFDSSEKLIVVKPLHVKSPIVKTGDYTTVSIEKIMVDLYVDELYVQYQGKELETIYENIFEKYDINEKKLISYASYRTNIDKFKELLNSLYIPGKYKFKEK